MPESIRQMLDRLLHEEVAKETATEGAVQDLAITVRNTLDPARRWLMLAAHSTRSTLIELAKAMRSDEVPRDQWPAVLQVLQERARTQNDRYAHRVRKMIDEFGSPGILARWGFSPEG